MIDDIESRYQFNYMALNVACQDMQVFRLPLLTEIGSLEYIDFKYVS